jgi:hypothetical protein
LASDGASLQTAGYTNTILDVSAVFRIGDMNIAGCSNGIPGNALPNDRSLYLHAWKTAQDNLHAAFAVARKFVSPEHAG